MTPRAAELVRLLGLAPHPEGGSYREFWRAPSSPGIRAASTCIYFLLDQGEFSRWHRVDADEIWTTLEGEPLELWTWDPAKAPERRLLDAAAESGCRPAEVVPAGLWQAARPVTGPVLSVCTVAPAFDFAGFSLLSAHPALSARLREGHPTAAALL
jgi:predicted cupin superfamily sugar epimerase